MKYIAHTCALFKHLISYLEIKCFQKRYFFFRIFGKNFEIPKNNQTIIAVIAHVVTDLKNPEKYDRLLNCLEHLLITLYGYKYEINILTKKGYSLVEELPEYIKKQLKVVYSEEPDPMYVEYGAYDIFKENYQQGDFFLFLEDDIILNDSSFLHKIMEFNAVSPSNKYLLFPHRFEFFEGIKHYPDQITKREQIETSYKHLESFSFKSVSGVKYCKHENPHAAFYCLSKPQMKIWISSGYKWRRKVVSFGVLESAVTFCLFENFEPMNCAPSYLDYFTVRHHGNKYILNDYDL